MTNCTFTGNTATSGSTTGLVGGAIYHNGTTATVSNSTFTGNAEIGAAAISSSGIMAVNNSVISGNSAINHGGGSYVTFATVNITNLTISNNVANTNSDLYEDGGGIWLRSDGRVNIVGSTISGNRTLRNTTTTDLRFAGRGGGAWIEGALTSDNSTVSGNFADLDGGGFYVAYPGGSVGVLNLNGSTVVNNAAAGTGGVA